MPTPETIVIKLGGKTVEGPTLANITADVAALVKRGARVVMVHGGGPQATALQKTLGLEPVIVAGRRVTDKDTLDIMKMVVGGRLNITLCSALIAAGVHPVGLNGASDLTVEAVKRPPRLVSGGGDEPVDFGHVGDIVGVNRELLDLLVGSGRVPVIACLGADRSGQVFNINGDLVANTVARALGADHLVLITSVRGVFENLDDPSSRLTKLTVEDARAAIGDGRIHGGMIPKVEESVQVIGDGVGAVHIVGLLGAGELLSELAEPGSAGTALVP